MVKLLLVLFSVVLAVWVYQSIQPQAPKLCGTPNGPRVTAPRSKLKDGRYLAYNEWGVQKQNAKYKIIYIHGFGSCRFVVPPSLRPGYGESDPDPKRNAETVVTDTEELADNLNLGPKFYVMGVSWGGAFTWSVIKHIPHRLAGAILLVPAANFWWSGFPSNVTMQMWNQLTPRDKWANWIARNFPSLVYWWNTQNLFARSGLISGDVRLFSPEDKQILPGLIAASADFVYNYLSLFSVDNFIGFNPFSWDKWQRNANIPIQQGIYESLLRDMIVWFSEWGFSPLELTNPFPNNEGRVHLWHGAKDWMVPVYMSRYIAEKLPWVQYHELPTAGHLFVFADGMADHVLKTFFKES